MNGICLILPCSKYNKRTELGNNSASFKEFPNGIKVSYRHFDSAFCFSVILCSLKFMTPYLSGSFSFKEFQVSLARLPTARDFHSTLTML